MLKHSNGLLYLQFKRCKWVLDYGKPGWYCGIKFSTIVKYHRSFPFVCQMRINDFKVLTRFSEITSLLKAWFYWLKTFDFLIQKHSIFYSEKRGVL